MMYRLFFHTVGTEEITLLVTPPAEWHGLTDVAQGEWMMYRCLHHLWDNGLPTPGLEFGYRPEIQIEEIEAQEIGGDA